MIDLSSLDLREPFRLLQTGSWLLAFICTLYLSGGKQWAASRFVLKMAVSGWASATFAMFILTVNLKADQLFPWGFTWWCAIAPLVMCVSATLLVWFCHSVMRELNKTNNRRASCMIAPPKIN